VNPEEINNTKVMLSLQAMGAFSFNKKQNIIIKMDQRRLVEKDCMKNLAKKLTLSIWTHISKL